MPLELTSLGDRIFKERYSLHIDETFLQACDRVAISVAANEKNPYHESDFRHHLCEGLFVPGGRIMRNAGTPVQSLMNCFYVPTEDSIQGWGKSVSDLMTISSSGGGVGLNFSSLRSRGTPISRGGESTGSVSLMEICNSVGDVLRGGGGRRVAMMFALDYNHGDASEFIHAKLDKGRLTNANISINIPADSSYSDLDSALWNSVIDNAWRSGEPGILNQKFAEDQSNISYAHKLSGVNPCAEQWLPDYGCCCLGSLVLPRFVVDGKFDWDGFSRAVRMGVRFLDNVLDVNDYPIRETRTMSLGERRIGLGIMGLHTMLLALGIKYTEGFEFVEKLMAFMSQTAYEASQDLAVEKGAFPLYDKRMHDSGFFGAHKNLEHKPMRNCAVLTCPPTGTTSMMMGVSHGVEPVFAARYIRRRYQGEGLVTTLVHSAEYQKYGDMVESAHEISPETHIQMLALIQKYVDSAVSKTINLPSDYPVESLKGLVETWLPKLKGVTFYRQGSRGNEPLEVVLSGAPDPVTDEIEFVDTEQADPCESGICQL